jgi:hypothetical protein
MPKSKPKGVRFDLDQLEVIQKENNLKSYQSVVNFLMNRYFKSEPKTVLMTPWGNIGPNLEFKPENGVPNTEPQKEAKNDPKEGSFAFYDKYGAATYAELNNNS